MTHCKIEAVQSIRTRGIYLRNDVRDRHIYIHTYIDHGERRLTSVGLAHARPN